MRNRTLRAALLALLLLALPPGAALAAGLQAEAVSCCCSHGTASEEVQASFDAPSCCKVSDGSSLPTTTPATVSPSSFVPTVAFDEAAIEPMAPVVPRAALLEVDRDLGRRPPPSLFTLHAAFLI